MNSKIQGSKRFWFVCYCFAICPIKKTKAWRQSLTRWKSRTTSIKSIRKDNGWGNFRDNTCMETCIYFIPLSWYQFTRTFCRSFFFSRETAPKCLTFQNLRQWLTHGGGYENIGRYHPPFLKWIFVNVPTHRLGVLDSLSLSLSLSLVAFLVSYFPTDSCHENASFPHNLIKILLHFNCNCSGIQEKVENEIENENELLH